MRAVSLLVAVCSCGVFVALLAALGCSSSPAGPSQSPPPPAANRPPTPGSIGVSPTGLGMAGATTFTFSSQGAQDLDGNPLTFTWTFGDGSAGTGSTAQHRYDATGTFVVELRVSDGQDTVAAPNINVLVGPNLEGSWGAVQSISGFPRLRLSQDGAQINGTFTPNVIVSGNFLDYDISGTVDNLTYPAPIRLATPNTACRAAQCAFGALFRYTIDAQINESGDRITGTLTLVVTTDAGTELPATVSAIGLAR